MQSAGELKPRKNDRGRDIRQRERSDAAREQ